jgi:hypothetical protein
MTPAEAAVNNAISFECKKDALQQRQSGDWKISFTVQGIDMDDRITKAPMGTRFVAVLVAINDDESPIQQPAKEKAKPETVSPQPSLANHKPSEKARRDWNEMLPSAAAAMRGNDPVFRAFLNEERGYSVQNHEEAAEAVRKICRVKSRRDLNVEGSNGMLMWQLLDSAYQAWLAKERVGA